MKRGFLCGMLALGLTISPLTTVFATDSDSITYPITYTTKDGNYVFEKVSHRNSGTETKDGIVDYTSPLQIKENTSGTSEDGDSVQSYTYCAATSGDWVYMGTMYGALSAYTQVERSVTQFGASAEVAKAVVDVMFNGKLNKGKEDDGRYSYKWTADIQRNGADDGGGSWPRRGGEAASGARGRRKGRRRQDRPHGGGTRRARRVHQATAE